MILDNQRSYWLGKKYKRIKFVFLPINSPKDNQMDTQFSIIKREVLNNSSFKSIKKVEESIDKWIIAFSSMK
jgi:transposase